MPSRVVDSKAKLFFEIQTGKWLYKKIVGSKERGLGDGMWAPAVLQADMC